MQIHYKVLIGIALMATLAFSCVPNPKSLKKGEGSAYELEPSSKGYSLIFFKIDDYVLVSLDDSLVFDSRKIAAKITKEVLVELDKYKFKNPKQLKVEGYNAECTSCNNNRWEIVYELYKDGEGIEYISEDSHDEHDGTGLKMVQTHQLIN